MKILNDKDGKPTEEEKKKLYEDAVETFKSQQEDLLANSMTYCMKDDEDT